MAVLLSTIMSKLIIWPGANPPTVVRVVIRIESGHQQNINIDRRYFFLFSTIIRLFETQIEKERGESDLDLNFQWTTHDHLPVDLDCNLNRPLV